MKILMRTRKTSRCDTNVSQASADAVIHEIFSFPNGLQPDRASGAFRRLADAPGITFIAAPTSHPVRL